MGQAKKRGTYDQRVAMAKERNTYLAGQLTFGSTLHTMEMRSGIQRVATRLTAVGMIPIPTREHHPNVK
jgi:hypothetical protein